jgi:alpha-glucosidase (family GH31 glycosyl hydrolase)
LGFYFPTVHLYGLPERVDTFYLKTTEKGEPYRMQSTDIFPHMTYRTEPTYSSIPYITGHEVGRDSSVAWVTAAESFVNIYKDYT